MRWFRDLAHADFLRSVGLYLTQDRLYLVRLRRDLFRFSVADVASAELSGSLDPEARREGLRGALRSLSSHFNPTRDPLYLCLSQDIAFECQVLLPMAAQENLRQVLDYELERLLPFRAEDVYFDFLPMGLRGDKLAVCLFAVPRERLEEIVDALSGLGATLVGAETGSTAIVNFLSFCSDEAPNGSAVVIGQQNQAWEIIALRRNNKGWSDKTEILFTHRLPKTHWVGGIGQELIGGLSRESPKFFSWGRIDDFLERMEVDPIELTDLLDLGKTRLRIPDSLSDSFMPALGVSLRGLREASLGVNLLPGARDRAEGGRLSRLNAFLGVVLLLVLLVWGGSFAVKDEIRLRQLETELKRVAPDVRGLQQKEEELNKLVKQMDALSKLSENRDEVLRVLDELSRIIPNSAYVTHLRYRDGTVELRGSAINSSNLVPLLERSALFEAVGFNAPSTRRGREERETFSLTAKIERTERGEGAL